MPIMIQDPWFKALKLKAKNSATWSKKKTVVVYMHI